MINQLLQIKRAFEYSGYILKGDSDPRVRWEESKGNKLCKIRPNGQFTLSDVPEGGFCHFIKQNNQRIYYRIKIPKNKSIPKIKSKIKSNIDFCKIQMERAENINIRKKFSNLLKGLENIDPNDLVDKVGEIGDDLFIFIETNGREPFIQTEEMTKMSLEYYEEEASRSKVIVDFLGREGHKIDVLYPLPPIYKGFDTKLFSRNEDIPGLKRFGKSGMETFPMTHQFAKEILGFASELFSPENRYSPENQQGHYAIRLSDNRVIAILSTIDIAYFTLSLGYKDYDRLARNALESYVEQDQSTSKASGQLLIIEWNDKEAPCVRLSKTISYKESNDLAKQWFADVKSGIQHPATWNPNASPEKPGGKGGGLTVLSLYDLINSKWRISGCEIKLDLKSNISIQDCYQLYLGDESTLIKFVGQLVSSHGPIAMAQESALSYVNFLRGKKLKVPAALVNQLYPLMNLLIARSLRAKGIKMENKDHWAFKIGRLCSTLNWMQRRSYELRNMEVPVRPLGLEIFKFAYNSPQKGLDRLVGRSLPIRKTLQKIAARGNDLARIPVNTFDKQYNELSEMLVDIPTKPSSLEKLIMTSGFCYKNYSRAFDAQKHPAPLENVND